MSMQANKVQPNIFVKETTTARLRNKILVRLCVDFTAVFGAPKLPVFRIDVDAFFNASQMRKLTSIVVDGTSRMKVVARIPPTLARGLGSVKLSYYFEEKSRLKSQLMHVLQYAL